MQATPMFLGACALASFAGAVSGATINTRVIQQAGIGSAEIDRPAIAFDPADTGHDQVALPDHYPMMTPNGRVEVAELSTRGVYSQPRYGYSEAYYVAPPQPAFLDPAPAAERGANSARQDAAEASGPAQPASASAAMKLDVPAAVSATSAPPSQPAGGQPKVIDVAATLAARD